LRWEDLRRSSNVEDRRGQGGFGRGGGGFRLGGGGKIGGFGLAIIVIASLFLGVDPTVLIDGGGSPSVPSEQTRAGGQDDARDFVAAVLGDTEQVWHAQFQQMGRKYKEPHLVLFSGVTQTACGYGQAAMGPFYCPADQRVYIDLSFFEDLRRRFGAPGDFAQAYVIAHEVAHHVQTLLGTSERVRQAQERGTRTAANAQSVRLELQADCYAGLWAHHAQAARQVLEQGDVEEALNAASAIGDDRLQRQAQGRVAPDSFTHGSSEQRVRWFKRGLSNGTLQACDTFSGNEL
jgi:predicted metalloprotease